MYLYEINSRMLLNLVYVIVVYISEYDVFRLGRTIYHIDSVIRETNTTVDDGLSRVFVNTQYADTDNTEVGELMKCFLQKEIDNVRKLGVKIECNVVIGKSVTIDQLMEEEGFEAVFIGSGAGLPKFMGIPGENAVGVFSANEFLTRNNLMKAFRDDYDTPIFRGTKVAVVGGGNVAMDAARTALRLGATTYIVYRRSEAELPARVEEVHHA